ERHIFRRLGPGRDQHGAPSTEHAVPDPAIGAFAVSDAPPIVGFGDDLHGETGAAEYPDDGLVGAWAFAHIDAVGFEADETGDRQVGLAVWPRRRRGVTPGMGLRARPQK